MCWVAVLAILAFYAPHSHPVISEANQLKATAYHEAGHAVACDRLGFKIKRVTIVRKKGEYLGACPVKHLRLHQADVVGRRACCKQLGRYHDYIVSIFAGGEAQRRFCARSLTRFSTSTDYEIVNGFLFGLHSGRKKEIFHVFRYLRARAQSFVSYPSNWRIIQDLATALLERKTLTGEEAKAVLLASQKALTRRRA
jgi:hypothetical protein